MSTLIKINETFENILINNHLDLGSDFNHRYLTKRETEILYYVVLGYTAKRIGKCLNISHRTVEVYIATLKSKLNCNSKGEIINMVLMSNIINRLNILK